MTSEVGVASYNTTTVASSIAATGVAAEGEANFAYTYQTTGSGGTTATLVASNNFVGNLGTATVTLAESVSASVNNSAGGTISTADSIKVLTPTGATTGLTRRATAPSPS